MKVDGNALAIFLQSGNFIDKTTSNVHPFNKMNDFITTQYVATVFYPFYLNP